MPSLLALVLLVPPALSLPSTCSQPADPCLPGGKYDPLLGKCQGYGGASCFGCYKGEFCDVLDAECTLGVGGGQPVLFQEYWETVDVCDETGMDFQTAYQGRNIGESNYQPLEDQIRLLHANVGNAETEGYTIVLGEGATGVMNAVMYALAATSAANETRSVFAQAPYYGNYVAQTWNAMAVDSDLNRHVLQWDEAADVDSESTFEIVTYPNNPDGALRSPHVSPSRAVFDCIYYWPQFASVDRKMAEDVMLFSASKHTGHAGTRLGWALVKDAAFAGHMKDFVQRSLGVSMDAQLRQAYALAHINAQWADGGAHAYYEFGAGKIAARFDAVAALFADPETGQLRERNGVAMLNNGARGAYVWLKCADGVDCQALLAGEARVAGTGGAGYGVGAEYARLQMMARTVEMDDLLERLGDFLGGDSGDVTRDWRGMYGKEMWEGKEREGMTGGC